MSRDIDAIRKLQKALNDFKLEMFTWNISASLCALDENEILVFQNTARNLSELNNNSYELIQLFRLKLIQQGEKR